MTNPNTPVTKKEALRYDKDALKIDVARRRKNIRLFQGEIAKEEAEIEKVFRIIEIIDASKK